MTDPLKQIIRDVEQGVAKKYAGQCYRDSYVAFLDILGMKELIKRPYGDLRAIFNAAESGRELYSRIQIPGGSPFISEEHLKMTIMSDALVLSIDSEIGYAFSKLIGFSSYLISSLLNALDIPVFLRGGIARGPIYQDSNTVFGPGLVGAYTIENNVAKSMRCVVSPDLDQDTSVQEYLITSGCALVVDPEDELRFIDFAKPDICDRLKKYSSEILESDVNGSVKEKYRWLLRYIEK
ncbi:hypothetical protein [Vreelandella utahensis]|uniref:hypothetical protein n=1 Tax=Vreelandella halophila TaxID=86177 RepID=UPI000985B9B6|nr:hypothetical protein [Halomonas utahensis]